MLVPPCHARRPKPALPCRGILRPKRPRLTSNLPLLCAHGPCCFAIYPARQQWLWRRVLLCFLLPLVIARCVSPSLSLCSDKSPVTELVPEGATWRPLLPKDDASFHQ